MKSLLTESYEDGEEGEDRRNLFAINQSAICSLAQSSSDSFDSTRLDDSIAAIRIKNDLRYL